MCSSNRLTRAALLATVSFAAIALACPAWADVIGTGTTTIDYSGSIVNYTVTIPGIYDIIEYGADGGNGFQSTGGQGAVIGGAFNLSAGTMVNVLVGQAGQNSGSYSGSGGGGSFVVSGTGAGATPLVIGGGGGGIFLGSYAGSNGSTGESGSAGQDGGGLAGVNGGGGGGGFTGNGADDSDFPGSGGGSFTGNGGAGGGGFGGGGGGGAYNHNGGGGGGGYNGGGGGGGGYGNGGGGGSYLAADAVALTLPSSLNTLDLGGNGEVVITYVGPSAADVPEPGSLALLGTGLLGLSFVARRKKPE